MRSNVRLVSQRGCTPYAHDVGYAKKILVIEVKMGSSRKPAEQLNLVAIE